MNQAEQTQNPVQPTPQAQAQVQAPAQAQAPGASGVPPKAPPRAMPGLRGIWADPEKCDTSDWNVFYYYYRQIAQHGGLKLKNLKWIGLIADLYFFVVILVVLYIKLVVLKNSSFSDVGDAAKVVVSLLVSGSVLFNPIGILFLLLAVVPVIMVGRAFKLQTRNHGFMTSRAKEEPILSHLVEYTTGKGLVEGVIQSFIYTYARLFLFLLPAILFFIVTGIVAVTLLPVEMTVPMLVISFLRVSLGVILGSLAAANFLTMQGFSYRVDSLCFIILLTAEFIFHYFSLARYLFSYDSFEIGRNLIFLLLSWASCMVYFPLAAADTLEFGIGKHARTIRLFLLGVILVNFLSLFMRIQRLDASKWDDMIFNTALVPALWIFVAVIGLLVSSLSAASYRAKHLFQLHMSNAKNALLVWFFDPASPSSVIPILALEIFVAGLFATMTAAPDSPSFWNGDENIFARISMMIAFCVWSSLHFALTFVIFTRRHSHKERKPWLTHPKFSGLFFLILAILGIVWVLAEGTIAFPFFYFVMSAVGLFCIWEPVNKPGENGSGQELTADFGREPQ